MISRRLGAMIHNIQHYAIMVAQSLTHERSSEALRVVQDQGAASCVDSVWSDETVAAQCVLRDAVYL